jgi:proline dehydrogenase
MNKLFNNTEVAFALKSDNELNRAYFLFKMISNPTLVKIGSSLANFALKLNLPVQGLIRATVFDHFCGGISENDCMPVMDKMFEKGVSSVLDYSVEGKEDEAHFDDAMQMTLKIIDFAKEKKSIPFAVFKPTGFGRFELYEKIGEGKTLDINEQTEWNRVVARFDVVCKAAFDNDISVLIDGEESWMQDAADQLVEQMMQRYNKNKCVVFNTLQMYRWDRLEYLEKLHKKAENEGFFIGMKLVRGAYMEKENARAEKLNQTAPICFSKEATDTNFDNAAKYMMQNFDKMSIFLGTHNEESSIKMIKMMQQSNISNADNRIWFGQLYGMSDNISYNLAKNGYNVAKYLPFGPVKEVMPYLIRRAQENTSVAGQTNRELNLLQTERNRRKQ